MVASFFRYFNKKSWGFLQGMWVKLFTEQCLFYVISRSVAYYGILKQKSWGWSNWKPIIWHWYWNSLNWEFTIYRNRWVYVMQRIYGVYRETNPMCGEYGFLIQPLRPNGLKRLSRSACRLWIVVVNMIDRYRLFKLVFWSSLDSRGGTQIINLYYIYSAFIFFSLNFVSTVHYFRRENVSSQVPNYFG